MLHRTAAKFGTTKIVRVNNPQPHTRYDGNVVIDRESGEILGYPHEVTLTEITCRKCGAEQPDRPANFPRPDLCESCFLGYVDQVMEGIEAGETPADLLEKRLKGEL